MKNITRMFIPCQKVFDPSGGIKQRRTKMSLGDALTQLKRADGIREHSVCLMLEQQRNFAKLFSA